MTKLQQIEVPRVDYGSEEAAMVRYREDGERRAAALGNRGPIRFDARGKLDPAIVEAYSRCGFYIFEGVLKQAELDDIERDVAEMLANAPVTRGALLDRQGRPALGADNKAPTISWVRAVVGSARRHQVRERAPSREDVRTGGAGRGAGTRRATDPRVAAVLRRVPARVRSPATARCCGGDQRRRLRAVQRSGVDQAGAARRLGRVASGRLDALGQSAIRRRHARLQFHGAAVRLQRRQRAVGRAGFASTRARRTSRRWSTLPVPIACPTRCR